MLLFSLVSVVIDFLASMTSESSSKRSEESSSWSALCIKSSQGLLIISRSPSVLSSRQRLAWLCYWQTKLRI